MKTSKTPASVSEFAGRCPNCCGTGRVVVRAANPGVRNQTTGLCYLCEGTGKGPDEFVTSNSLPAKVATPAAPLKVAKTTKTAKTEAKAAPVAKATKPAKKTAEPTPAVATEEKAPREKKFLGNLQEKVLRLLAGSKVGLSRPAIYEALGVDSGLGSALGRIKGQTDPHSLLGRGFVRAETVEGEKNTVWTITKEGRTALATFDKSAK